MSGRNQSQIYAELTELSAILLLHGCAAIRQPDAPVTLNAWPHAHALRPVDHPTFSPPTATHMNPYSNK